MQKNTSPNTGGAGKTPDMYILGTLGDSVTCWKNGVPTLLTTGTNSSVANSVFVVGDDVYVAGYQWIARQTGYIATYWKNGEVVKLTDGVTGAIANSIYVQ